MTSRDCSRLFGGPRVTTGALMREEVGEEGVRVMSEKDSAVVAGFEAGGRGRELRNAHSF